jgi:hypothetical protein
METRKLIGEVAARHGVRLDEDDPALVLVTLAELALRDAREEFAVAAQRATLEFVEAAGCVQGRAGSTIAAAIREAGTEVRERIARDLNTANLVAEDLVQRVHRAHETPVRYRWVIVGLVVGLALFVAGFALGRLLS